MDYTDFEDFNSPAGGVELSDTLADWRQKTNGIIMKVDSLETGINAASNIDDNAIVLEKIEQIDGLKVLGNTSSSTGNVSEVSVLDEDTLSSNSATALATQQSIKAYVDNLQFKRSLFIYQSSGYTEISTSGNTTCPLTESFSDDSSMSVSENVVTLAAGTYIIKADANIAMGNNNTHNNTTGAIVDTDDNDSVLIAGKMLHSYNDYAFETTHDFSCIGKITLPSSTTIALKFRRDGGTHSYIGRDTTVTGMGIPIHATVYIEKIA